MNLFFLILTLLLSFLGLEGFCYDVQLGKILFFGLDNSVIRDIIPIVFPIVISSKPIINGDQMKIKSIVPYDVIGNILENYFRDSYCSFSYDFGTDKILLLSSTPENTYQTLGNLFFN